MYFDIKRRKVQLVWFSRLPHRANRIGRRWLVLPALLLACLIPDRSDAQILDIISIINAAVKKAIVAADLEVERLQTQTIGLQNAEKDLENNMDASELSDIAGWVQDQKELFAEYYQELWQVKNALSSYEQVKAMIEKQEQIVTGYNQVYGAVGKDSHFSAAEVSHMYAVLSGILNQSIQNINRLTTVITALVTQMNDAGRLRMIDETGVDIDKNYRDMAQFSQETYMLSMQRARGSDDVATVQALYGVQ